MVYREFIVDGVTYKLRLNTRNIVALEKELGKNPLYLFANEANNNLPTLEEMVLVLFYSLKAFQPNITDLEQAYEIFDKWLDEGHICGEFTKEVMEIFILSGIFKAKTEKN